MSRVLPSDILQAMSGSYRSPFSIVAGGGGGGGHHHGHHGHGGGGRRFGRGGSGPWWGYDDGVAVVEESDRGCDGGLYAPSGNLVCPGDPGYEALRRSVSHSSGATDGSTSSAKLVPVKAGSTWKVWADFSRTPSPEEIRTIVEVLSRGADVESFSAPDPEAPGRLLITVSFKKDMSVQTGVKLEAPVAPPSLPLAVTIVDMQDVTAVTPKEDLPALPAPLTKDSGKNTGVLLALGGGALLLTMMLGGRR